MGKTDLEQVVHATYYFPSPTPSGHKLFGQAWVPEGCLLDQERTRAEIERSLAKAPPAQKTASSNNAKASDYGDFGRTLSVDELKVLRHDPRNVRAYVLFLHGLHSNSSFGTMDPIARGELHRKYQGSVPHRLNEHGMVVFAHDHMGHGRTLTASGKHDHRVIDRFQTLELDALQHIELIRSLASSDSATEDNAAMQNKPLFIIGESMGGLLAVCLALHHHEKVFPTRESTGGLVLIAPAVLPPSNMFGIKGRILYPLSGLVSALFPRLDAVKIPGCGLFPEIQKEFDSDPWTGRGMLKARLGREIIQAQKQVEKHMKELKCPFLVLYGTEDTLTDPQKGAELFQQASSSDKQTIILSGMWHILLYEPRADEARSAVYSWIFARC
jgi:acylglycerol lipase